MRKTLFLFLALTLSAGLWAQSAGDQFVDKTSGLRFEITAVGETNTVKVIRNDYAGTSYTVPATVTYQSKTFTVTTIGDGAFFNCNALQSITLSASVTTIKYNAFKTCKALQSIDLSHVTTIEYAAFDQCKALQSIDLSHVTTIESSVFNGCTALQFVTLSENLTTIETSAFSNCILQSITLPASVTTIGEKAFFNCLHLTDVTVAWTEAAKIPTIDENVFRNIANSQGPSGATLHVPDGTKMLYQAAAVWNTFDTIIELAEYKAAAIAEIKQLATDAKTAIDAASPYKAADAIKLDYKAKIDLIVEAAIEAINSDEATTVARVDELRSLAVLRINGRKEEALTAIAKINEFEDAKVQAIADITNARQGIQNENLNNWIEAAISDIQHGAPDATPGIDEIKEEILNLINFFKEGKAEGETTGDAAGYQRGLAEGDSIGYARGKAEGIEEGKAAGKAEGLAEAKAALPTDPEGTAGHTVTITKGEKTLILVNPDKVTYGKQE